MPDHVGDRGAVRLDPGAHDHLHINQMSMPKPLRPNMATHSPRLAGGPDGVEAARRVARAGRAAICRQNPSSRGHGAEGPCLGAASLHPGHLRGIGPRTGTRKDPDPRRRSSRGSGGSEQACLPGDGGYATPAACLVSTTSWRYDLRRTCRLVTGRSHRPRSTWPDQARLPLPAVTHRYKRHIVFGSNNFRSPIKCGLLAAKAGNPACADHSLRCVDGPSVGEWRLLSS